MSEGTLETPKESLPVPAPIRVLLADNHPVMLTGLALMLRYEPDMEAVAQAGDGEEAVALFRQHRPDVALLDLRMPRMGGAAATAAICAEFPSARVILLSTYSGDEDIYGGIRAGAKAYLLKDAPCEQILATIRKVHAGDKYMPAEVGAKLMERMAGPELTDRERDVLRLLARGASNQEIAAALFITVGTVKFHVNHILGKLEASDRTQAVITALRRGIVSLS